jgi:threonine/homoserine/homoserine lactone efflux protein
VLSLLGCTVEMIVLGGYVLIAHSVRGALLKRGVREWVERASGVAFLGLAGATAFWRRAG